MRINPLRAFKRAISPTYVGLDIGTTSIKIVEVKNEKNRSRIVNYGILESKGSIMRTNTALQTSGLKLFDQEVAELLKLLVKKMQPKAKIVVASIPLFSAFTTVITLPEMNSADLEKAISFQARQYIPIPLSEVALDWMKVAEYEDEKGFKFVQVLLISVPRERIETYKTICAKAGLTLSSLEIEPMSTMRVLVGDDPTPTCIIDIGARSTSIAFVEGGTLRFLGQTDFASSSLTQALASSLNINPMRAEELKKEKGIVRTGPEYELSTIMMPLLDAIISEVRRVDFAYHSQFPVAQKIERTILSGGGSILPGAQNYFQKQLGMSVVIASPFSKFEYPGEIEPLMRDLNPTLTVALGLALRRS